MLETCKVWHFLSSFQSTAVTQALLHKNYERLAIPDAGTKGYENCYPFIYYIEHGKKYFDVAKSAPYEIKPNLLFYGMTQLMKACLLTVDPDYPATTAVLAHGVSTRKKKKQHYAFLQDEVKIQKKGLLRHFALQLFRYEFTDFRFNMEGLFARIAELNDIFSIVNNTVPSLQLVKKGKGSYLISKTILDRLHMTKERFQQFLTARGVPFHTLEREDKNHMLLEITIDNPLTCSPLFANMEGDYFIPSKRELYVPMNETIVHYLLLYNLSIICRYETEWWNELFHSFSSNDLLFIRQFLNVCEQKTPYLFALLLQEQWMKK